MTVWFVLALFRAALLHLLASEFELWLSQQKLQLRLPSATAPTE